MGYIVGIRRIRQTAGEEDHLFTGKDLPVGEEKPDADDASGIKAAAVKRWYRSPPDREPERI